MAKTEKRWQLLLVADDGRIVPFKRIKGVVVAVVILLVLLGLFCAGLAWQLTAEKVRHRRSQEQLADAQRQVTHYKREHELIAAELVLAEARMEKAGLPVPRRQERVPQQTAAEPVDSEATAGTAVHEAATAPPAELTGETAASVQPAVSASATPEVGAESQVALEPPSVETKPDATSTVVALGDLEMGHDIEKKVLLARFRVNNDGPRSSPLAGQCVVVLKTEGTDADTWQAMPDVRMTEGLPDGKRGRSFRISRFIDMEIIAPVQGDPSAFTTATVYVFDPSGAELLSKDFSIDLPAPAPEPATEATVQPAVEDASSNAPQSPMVTVDGLKIVHDAQKKVLLAQFRISNTGSATVPVAGRCVVVLHDPQMDPEAWLAMPGVVLVNGEPDGARGQAFKISRFRDMEIKAMGQTDPSPFTVASLYVFDTSGARLVKKDVSIDLPAPEPETQAAIESTAPAMPSQPMDQTPVDQAATAPSSPEATGATDAGQSAEQAPDQPAVAAPPTIPSAPPVGDPSLNDNAEPTGRPDSRARF